MNTVNIYVKVSNKSEMVNLVLFQKIYATNAGIVNYWVTNSNSEYRLEIIFDENDLSINPLKITKSESILTDESNIADQMMKLQGNENFQLHNN
ncbi:MAG: hypothetical protein PF485_12500 [Bacteroidales bacterium]|jgi:hypothetical protein|nr:hypothetical protein [Bacteroidales bacterium]